MFRVSYVTYMLLDLAGVALQRGDGLGVGVQLHTATRLVMDVRRTAILQLNGLHGAGVEAICHTERSEVKHSQGLYLREFANVGTFRRVVDECRGPVLQLHGLTVLKR